MKLRKFDDYLNVKLRDPAYAVACMETALEDGGIEDFLCALRKVAVAQGGVQKVAEESRHGREGFYKPLSKQGNPRIKTLDGILHALEMRLAVTHSVEESQPMPEQAQVAAHG